MNLPQQTLDRIEKEAFGMMRSLRDEDFLNYDTAVEMIKAEALRALPLYEALKKAVQGFEENRIIISIEEAKVVLASYESGEEPVQGKEAKEFGNFLLSFTPLELSRHERIWWDKIIGGNRYTTEQLYKQWQQSLKP